MELVAPDSPTEVDLEAPVSTLKTQVDSVLLSRDKEHQAVFPVQVLDWEDQAREAYLQLPDLGQMPETTALPLQAHQDISEVF